jgi:hypothetical protein
MADSKVSFDSSDVSSIVSSLNSSAQALVSVGSTVQSTLTPLTSCDLFTDGVSKLVSKLESVKSSFESIVTAIGGQTQTYSDVESAVQQAGDNYMSYYGGGSGGSSGGSGGGGGSSSSEGLFTAGMQIDQGQAVNTSLDDVVKEIDDKTIINFLNFVNVNKGEKANINDILKEENSEILMKYLVAFYKKYENKNLTATDQTLIRKELIKKILNAKVDLPKDFKDNSIIKFKTYLESIATKCKTTVADLITEPEYKETMKTALSNLYLNKVDISKYGISESDLNSFRELVAKVSKIKNIKAEEVFSNPIYLV